MPLPHQRQGRRGIHREFANEADPKRSNEFESPLRVTTSGGYGCSQQDDVLYICIIKYSSGPHNNSKWKEYF